MVVVRVHVGQQEQEKHLIRPLSLQAVHVLNPPFSAYTLRAPEHSPHSTNLWSPHTWHCRRESAAGNPSRSFLSSPLSCSHLTSSAPPTYLPLIKTRGRVNPLTRPVTRRSSRRKPESIDTSRSSKATLNPLRMERTVLQSSNVARTTRRLVKYTTTRCSARGTATGEPVSAAGGSVSVARESFSTGRGYVSVARESWGWVSLCGWLRR